MGKENKDLWEKLRAMSDDCARVRVLLRLIRDYASSAQSDFGWGDLIYLMEICCDLLEEVDNGFYHVGAFDQVYQAAQD